MITIKFPHSYHSLLLRLSRQGVLWSLYVLVGMTPLVMSTSTSEMFEFPKMLIIYATSLTMLCAWSIGQILSPRQIAVRPSHIAFVLFAVSQLIATLTSIDIHTSLFGYYGRFNGGLLSTVAYGVILFVASQSLSEREFRNVMRLSLVVAIVVLIWGLPGRLVGVDLSCVLFRGDFSTSCWTNEFRPQERMFSTLGQPNWLGVYLVAHVGIALYLYLSHVKISTIRVLHDMMRDRTTIVYLLIIVALIAGVILTGSRSSQIGLVIGGMVGVLIMFWRQGRKRAVMVCTGLIVIVALVSGGWYVRRISTSIRQDVTHSGAIRLIVWEGAVRLALRYPLTGTGPETFAYSYFLTRPESHNLTSEKDLIYNKAHNELLNILATSGVIGLTTYVVMIGVFIRQLLKVRHGLPIACAIVAITVANTLGFSTSTSQMLLYLIVAYGLLEDRSYTITTRVTHPLWRVALVTVVVVVWVWGAQYIGRYYEGDISYAAGMNYQYSGDYLGAIDAYSTALDARFEHVYAAKYALVLAQTAYALATTDEHDSYASQIAQYIHSADRVQTAVLRASPRNPLYWRDRVRMLEMIQSIVTGDELARVTREIHTAVKMVRLLAPTDLEGREMEKRVGK